MEASEEFAFSGAKFLMLQLVPFSRRSVRYGVLATGGEGRWIRPGLRVVDVGFGKVLKVGGAEGVRVDGNGKGVEVWFEGKG